MHIALIAPPFISVPPQHYGGTELFLAHLAVGLHERGHDVIVYANGDSRVPCKLKWRYRSADWPITDPMAAQFKNIDHTAWAIADAREWVDVVHINDTIGVPLTRFLYQPVVLTIHHPFEPALSACYAQYPSINYVAISNHQARAQPMPSVSVIHHGIPLSDYTFRAKKDDYLVFLGRMAPCKGAHLAIQAARQCGLPLKLAGEIQPVFRSYWESEVQPFIDGTQIQYVGEADKRRKNELLSRARALLFPIQWDEPFGLVMAEAMACGTPVVALRGGSVAEVVSDGVSGWICDNVDELAERAAAPIAPESCRSWVEQHFSCDRMVDRYVELYDRALARSDGSEVAAAAI